MTKIALIWLIIIFLNITMGLGYFDSSDDWEKHHNAYQPPEKVMDAMGIKPGMTIAEVGAGRGRYAVRIADHIGNTGIIYANDIDKESLDYLKYRCTRDTITNVEIILGTETDPCLPAGKIDIVYIINTYHHIEKPVEILKNILPSLSPNGRLIIIEHDPDKVMKLGWDQSSIEGHSTYPNTVIEQSVSAGFKLIEIKTFDFLPRDNMYFLQAE